MKALYYFPNPCWHQLIIRLNGLLVNGREYMFQSFQMLFIDIALAYLLQCKCSQLGCLVHKSKVLGNGMLERYDSVVTKLNLS